MGGIVLIAIVGAAILSGLTLHAGAGLAVALLGRERCLSTDSINGINWWPLSVILSTGLVAATAGRHGAHALALIPVGPVVTVILASLSMRFGERSARRREFEIREGRVVERASREALRPAFVVADGSYACTGPASGYTLYALTLHDARGRRFTNGYVSKEENDRVFSALTRELGCLGLGLVVAWRESPSVFTSVTLGSAWTPLLCGGLARLEPQDRDWWAQWLQPAFGLLGQREVDALELARRLDALEEAYADHEGRAERIGQDLAGLRALLRTASGPVRLLTSEAHSQAVEGARGKGWVMLRMAEEGYWIESLEGEA